MASTDFFYMVRWSLLPMSLCYQPYRKAWLHKISQQCSKKLCVSQKTNLMRNLRVENGSESSSGLTCTRLAARKRVRLRRAPPKQKSSKLNFGRAVVQRHQRGQISTVRFTRRPVKAAASKHVFSAPCFSGQSIWQLYTLSVQCVL